VFHFDSTISSAVRTTGAAARIEPTAAGGPLSSELLANIQRYWQAANFTTFLNPARDGAVLPILHLNGYKIANPTVLGRSIDRDVHAQIVSNGYEVHFAEGDDLPRMHQAFAATLETCYERLGTSRKTLVARRVRTDRAPIRDRIGQP